MIAGYHSNNVTRLFITLLTLTLTCYTATATPEFSKAPIRGDRLSGVVLPVRPRASDISISGLKASAWTVDDTKRLIIEKDVIIEIGAYTFDCDNAAIWINRMPTDAGVVTQIAVYIPNFSKSTRRRGLGANGENLLIVGSTLGSVSLNVALLKQGQPKDNKQFVVKAENRLAGYIYGLETSQPTLTTHPQVVLPNNSTEAEGYLPVPELENPKKWLRSDSGFVSVSADQVELKTGEDENTVTIVGQVHLELESTAGIDDMKMTSTRGVIFLNPGSIRDIASGRIKMDSINGIYLEGNVVINANQGNYLLRAPQIYYDFETGKAIMLESVLRTYIRDGQVPLFIRADEMRQISANQWTATGVQASTSSFKTPDLSIGSKRMTITQYEDGNTYVNSEDNTLRLGGLPIMYWPKYEGEAGDIPLRRVKQGYKKNRGFVIETKWDFFSLIGKEKPDGLSTDMHLDGYTKRGIGVGFDFDYKFTSSEGFLDVYLMSDSNTQKTYSGIEQEVTNSTRGYTFWKDETRLNQNWTLQTQLSYISDPTFMSVWRQNDYQNHGEYETSIYAKYQKKNSAFTALASSDINQFISTSWLLASRQYKVDKTPELGYYRYADSIFDGAVNWSSETRLMRERMVFQSGTPNSLGLRAAAFAFPDGTVIGNNTPIESPLVTRGLTQDYQNRLTTRHEFTLPLQIGSVKLVPFTSIQGFWGIGNDNDIREPDSNYWMRTIGVRASTQFSRIYNGVDNDLLDLHRLRHIVEPYATLWDADSNINPAALPQYDALLDNISTGTAVWFGVKNRLQTWRGGPGRWYSVDWLTFDAAVLFANDGATQRYDNPQFFNWRPEYSSLEDSAVIDGKWQFSDSIAFTGNSTWNLDDGTYSRGSVGAELDHDRDIRTYIEYREIGNTNDQFLSLGVRYDLGKRYTLDFSPSWNFNIDDLQSLHFGVTRHYPEFDLIGQITYNEIQDETMFGLKFHLLHF